MAIRGTETTDGRRLMKIGPDIHGLERHARRVLGDVDEPDDAWQLKKLFEALADEAECLHADLDDAADDDQEEEDEECDADNDEDDEKEEDEEPRSA